MRKLLVTAILAVIVVAGGVALYWGSQHKWDYSEFSLGALFGKESEIATDSGSAVSEAGLKILKEKAEAGDDVANFQLGLLYENGADGFEADPEIAKSYYKPLVEKGYAKAQFRLGYIYYNEDRKAEAFELFKKSADRGYHLGQYNMGFFYENDLEHRDYKKAGHYYELAAKQGYSNAINNLASLYLRGLGTEQNLEKALNYYLQSYQIDGNLTALNNIAVLYANLGDQESALKYHRMGVEKGVVNSIVYLGKYYLYGDSNVERTEEQRNADYKEAFKYFKKAAEAGSGEAYLQLGNIYALGVGVEKEGQYALYNYRLAAENGSSYGYLGMAKLYEEGDLIAQNMDKAVENLVKALEAGNAQAALVLGTYYLQGTGGIEQDLKSAEQLLLIALQSGDADVQREASKFFVVEPKEGADDDKKDEKKAQ